MPDRLAERCYLIDVDGTLVKPGTEEFLDGALYLCNRYHEQGFQVWLFTCRHPDGQWVSILKQKGLKFHGVIQKPYAEEYFYMDDKVIGSASKLL